MVFDDASDARSIDGACSSRTEPAVAAIRSIEQLAIRSVLGLAAALSARGRHSARPAAIDRARKLSREPERVQHAQRRSPGPTPMIVAAGLVPTSDPARTPITAGTENSSARVVIREAHRSHGESEIATLAARPRTTPASPTVADTATSPMPPARRAVGRARLGASLERTLPRQRDALIGDQLYWATPPCQLLSPQFEKFFTKSATESVMQ